jgi:hypothetical protein
MVDTFLVTVSNSVSFNSILTSILFTLATCMERSVQRSLTWVTYIIF